MAGIAFFHGFTKLPQCVLGILDRSCIARDIIEVLVYRHAEPHEFPRQYGTEMVFAFSRHAGYQIRVKERSLGVETSPAHRHQHHQHQH